MLCISILLVTQLRSNKYKNIVILYTLFRLKYEGFLRILKLSSDYITYKF